MRRRLEIARGLMHTPEVLFLDEPTLGLDPQTRRHIWGYIEKLKKQGITIMLTTHYLEEADFLCDRVAIIDHGKIKALDTPKRLKGMIGGNVIYATSQPARQACRGSEKEGHCKAPRIEGMTVSFEVKESGKAMPKVMEAALKAEIEIESIELRVPSLEDVFIHYTGTSIREEKAGPSG